MYRQEIDMTNIKPDNDIVRLINVLNQEGIDLEAGYGTSGKRKALSNAPEDNLQSITEAGNNTIVTQTNNMVVLNDIQNQTLRQEPVEENEVQSQALRQEPEDNEGQRQASRQEPLKFNEIQSQASR